MPRWAPKTDADYIRHWLSKTIITPSGCWEWQDHCVEFRNIKPGQRGYPEAFYRGKKYRLTRVVLALSLGRPLVEKEQAGHHCDNPPCWNPNHLYPTNNQQNHLDGGKRKRMQGQTKTHCKNGHEFTPENTYLNHRPGGGCSRKCKACDKARFQTPEYKAWQKEYSRQRRARLKAERPTLGK
jgi:hypothetical protein